MKSFAIKGCLFVFLILLACVFVFWLSSRSPNFIVHSHPSDEQLIDNFTQHRAEFDQLAQMLIEEQELFVIFPDDPGKCQIKDQKLIKATDNSKCNDFVQLFKRLGLEWAYSGSEPLRLPVSFSGISVSGSTKGYYYSSDPSALSSEIVSNTDKASGQSVYRHIEGNWYIFLDRN
jgi:hypothetical protein